MFNFIKNISNWSINNPKKTIALNVFSALFLLTLVVLPLIFPTLPLSKLKIDTDPENMLSKNEEVRVFHNDMRKKFKLYDIIVLGVVEKNHPQGVFNTKTLDGVYQLTEYAKTIEGVVKKEIIAPSTVDSIEAGGSGVVNFNWLMKTPPQSDVHANRIYEQAARIPFLNGTLVSEDGKALAVYIPIKEKDLSYDTVKLLKEKASELDMSDAIYITGLPVAQDQFGVEMFKQMAISAPMAMMFIFLLMYLFFRNVRLISAPLIVAFLSVVITMGLLIATGNTVHIMSSMIPIFIMPIAVLDAIHILSDFFDVYHKHGNQKKAITSVMDELFMPMLYTSITTVVGFASLAFTPIPPVQVFGIFVALGVAFAWISTITFIPAFIMLIKPKNFKNFGLQKGEHDNSKTAKFLLALGKKTSSHYRSIIVLSIGLIATAFIGINKININDNPVKWFNAKHEIRVADKALNERFAGTYMAYLSLHSNIPLRNLSRLAMAKGFPVSVISKPVDDKGEFIDNLRDYADEKDSDAMHNKIDDLETMLQVFKNPKALAYMEKLQEHILTTGIVGKSSSLTDVVKTVHRDLYEGKETDFKIPSSSAAVAQTLITYQSSHRPNDLWHFVTTDYSKANIWIQLNSGDNQDMSKVIASVDEFVKANPAPYNIKTKWFGMTYINVIWQEKMVSGMMKSFLGSFLIVLFLMTVLFKSVAWGALAMLPLTITIGFIYGLIGFIGRDYDMPIAVLSSLSIGLAVDYAIHFLARTRELHKTNKTWDKTIKPLFGEPAKAIFRNVIVVSIGFFPLLVAPLVPYQTVGVFISAILFFAGFVTLVVLPASMRLFYKYLFSGDENKMSLITKVSIVLMFILIIVQNLM